MGESLTVKLPSPAAKGQKVSLKISYETTDGAVAIQWLEKEYVLFHRICVLEYDLTFC